MDLEKKYISKENWKRVIKRETSYMELNHNEFQGEAYLIKVKEVKEPLYKVYEKRNIKLLDNGYYWLQLAIKNKNYWITAMYDNKKQLIQYYIDITKENIIKTKGKSFFYDLFLDIVQLSNKKIYLLDEDELLDALNNKIIDKDTFDLAYKEAESIEEQLKKNSFKPIKICKEYLEKLSAIIKEVENKEENIN